MTKTKRLAIEAMKKQVQRIAFDANLFDRGLIDHPHYEQASKKRKELLAAIKQLESEEE